MKKKCAITKEVDPNRTWSVLITHHFRFQPSCPNIFPEYSCTCISQSKMTSLTGIMISFRRQSYCGECKAQYFLKDAWVDCPVSTTGSAGIRIVTKWSGAYVVPSLFACCCCIYFYLFFSFFFLFSFCLLFRFRIQGM